MATKLDLAHIFSPGSNQSPSSAKLRADIEKAFQKIVAANARHSVAAPPPVADQTEAVQVIKGDTLWDIAQSHQVNLQDLVRYNRHIADPNLIRPGDIVLINRPAAADAQGAEAALIHEAAEAGDQTALRRHLDAFFAKRVGHGPRTDANRDKANSAYHELFAHHQPSPKAIGLIHAWVDAASKRWDTTGSMVPSPTEPKGIDRPRVADAR